MGDFVDVQKEIELTLCRHCARHLYMHGPGDACNFGLSRRQVLRSMTSMRKYKFELYSLAETTHG